MIKNKLTEVLYLLENGSFEKVFPLLVSIKPQEESLMQQECSELLKYVYNGYHQLIRKSFFKDEKPDKYLDIIGNVVDYYNAQVGNDEEEYIKNLANTIRYVGLCFEAQKKWNEAATIHNILWEYCTERNSLLLCTRSINDLARCKRRLGDEDEVLGLYGQLESYFDKYLDDEARTIDVLFELAHGMSTYAIILVRAKRDWDTYRLFLKAYCAMGYGNCSYSSGMFRRLLVFVTQHLFAILPRIILVETDFVKN